MADTPTPDQNENQTAPAEQPAAPGAEPKEAKGAYGKRPLWQWVLLYIVVAGILYYVIYLLFFAGKAGGGTPGY